MTGTGQRYRRPVASASPDNSHRPRIAIQGGSGSFNEIAVRERVMPWLGQRVHLLYALTTDRVLTALRNGIADYGHFAVHTDAAGPVDETKAAMASYFEQGCSLRTLLRYDMPTAYVLLAPPGITTMRTATLVAHEQAYRDCERVLQSVIPWAVYQPALCTGRDVSELAELLRDGHLGNDVALLGHPGLSALYGLERLDTEAIGHAVTRFVLVERT